MEVDRANRQRRGAVTVIELIGLVRINDRYGHFAGDRIIFEALARLERHAAECNSEDHLAGCEAERIGGTTYAVDLGHDVDAVRLIQVDMGASLAAMAIESEPYDLADPENPAWTSSLPRHIWISVRQVTGLREAGETLTEAGQRIPRSLRRYANVLPRSVESADESTPAITPPWNASL